jgi:hypothetical protein
VKSFRKGGTLIKGKPLAGGTRRPGCQSQLCVTLTKSPGSVSGLPFHSSGEDNNTCLSCLVLGR